MFRATIAWLVLSVVPLPGCADGSQRGQRADIDDGSLQGTLAIYLADDFTGPSQTRYALRLASGVERPLIFDKAVDLTPGTSIEVWGTELPDGVRVTSFQHIFRQDVPSVERATSPLLSATAYPPRSFAFVLVDIGSGINVTTDGALGTLINDPNSIRNYYLDDSYGRQDITAEIIGPLSYPLATCSTADMNTLARTLRPMVTGTFEHFLWYLGNRLPACAFVGLASVGTPDAPSRDTWFNASTNCIVLVQEPGHNFGMQHSSSLICPGAAFADDPNTCTASEYGDPYDPMGNGCRHMNAWQKAYQGWFGGCNGVSVTASGTFTLLPLENRCDGAQFLKVKAAKSRTFDRAAAGGGGASTETMAYYYVELRTPVDFDGTLGNRTAMLPQVLIHAGDDIRSRAQIGVHTYLLDMAPGVAGNAALAVGNTFTDPAGGVSITTQAVSAKQATIKVEIVEGTGDPTCLDGPTFPAPGPGSEACGTNGGSSGGTGGGTGGAMPATGGAAGNVGISGGGGASSDDGGTADGATPSDKGGCECAINADAPPWSGGSPLFTAFAAIALILSGRAGGWRRATPSAPRRRRSRAPMS